MEIICQCKHRIKDHDEYGCWYHYFGGTCSCNLPPDAVEARYWARWSYRQMQAAIRSTNHWMIIAGKQKAEYSELEEQLRMCQLALRTMELAQEELSEYTKIAVDALKKIAQAKGGVIAIDDLGHKIEFNNYEGDIAIKALDRIKGKF